MSNSFQAMICKYRGRMRLLRETFDREGCLFATSSRDPDYSVLLTRNPSSEAAWRVTSFRGQAPIGHREYDQLDTGSPVQRAFQEFAGESMVLRQRGAKALSPAPQPS